MTNRSSKARIWNEARTRMAMSSARSGRGRGCRARAPRSRRRSARPRPRRPRRRARGPSRPRHLGPQRLAEPALVGGDQAGGGGEDVRGRAVVALQPDHLGAGEVPLEAQDVVHLGAAPAVDRLVVVADAADVAGGLRRAAAATGTGRRWCPGTRRPGCSGTGAGSRPARPACAGRWSGCAAAGRRSRRRSAPAAAPGTAA